MKKFWLVVGILSLAGCSRSEQSATRAGFVNKVWKVSESTAVQPGQLYVFLSEGTLVIASTTGTPSLGSWKRVDASTITMVEEGLPYQADILELGPSVFRLRVHNPGSPIEIRLAPAD